MPVMQAAEQALLDRDPERALALVRADPQSAHTPEALELTAQILLHLGRPEEALESLHAQQSAALGTANSARLESLVHEALSDYPSAVEAASRAVALNPKSAVFAQRHGEALFRARRPHAALEELHRALELDDTVGSTWHALAGVYLHLESVDDARFASQQAAALAPLNVPIQARFADLLARAGELEAAARVLHTALQHYPNDRELRSQLAVLLDRPISGAFLAWVSLWMVLMGVSLLLGVALNPLVGGICFLFLLVGMVVWGASFSEDSDGSRLEQAVPGVTALVHQIKEERQREERTRDNPWTPPEV